ncbi:MAG: UbiD family decarboxylase [Planctomycetaceae bacterium]|uniref:4-hydroxybenzoate decarboxylase subunit C n=1 Tax=Lacipirellula limnantheis TaxID=2528024 RepID=A0A517TSR6_9BACT|nr:UbiD family decarboxylase [Lacipirellula limnantheis]MBL9165757.1 UbiD family decarboxylase [Planctomycetaceae bacterium]QDT71409.1 4-hydroxybenzoate decarboxylase subunit C [Lacipirellula limnantheis]
MSYASLRECVDDLERHRQLIRIESPVDAHLEAAAIHRRVHAAGGPAIYFANVTGCQFPMVSNLFGTIERTRLMFRDALAGVEQLVRLKANPQAALQHIWRYWRAPLDARYMLPKYVGSGPILAGQTTISQLPQMQSWPHDGGPFVTLPIVYSEDVREPGLRRSNLGMYRVQLAGNQYRRDAEIGLHYQIHRSIGVHHAAAQAAGQPFRVNVLVGGPPSMAVAAVMPLPEGMSELGFAGALGRRRVRMIRRPGALPIHADSDFCIVGTVDPDRLLPEGPFGDHLGYYSLAHDFPVLRVEAVYHRRDAIWPFTVVGRPPQEDTMFGQLIHELTGPMIPTVLPGVHGVHAVDAAGVHPLLLAIGSERYMPFLDAARPQELLTQACAILGQGQLSLAKYLLIVAHHDDPRLQVDDVAAFFSHVLARADWRRDLHFHTQTTIDTLDYSGGGFNAGSKVVVAAAGTKRFELATELPAMLPLPEGFRHPRLVMPGVVAVEGPACPKPSFDHDESARARGIAREETAGVMRRFCEALDVAHPINCFRLIVVVDDSRFVSESLNNFLWAVFTRSNPADDIYGIDEFISEKHWGCRGALVIDARIKPHHAPVLEEDPEIARRVDALGAPGGPLHGII